MTLITAKTTFTLWLIAMAAVPLSAATIFVEPASLTVEDGTAFSVSIAITGAVDLYAFQFDLGFNPSMLSATGIAEGPLLAGGGDTFFIPGAIDNVAGVISFTGNTLVTALSGVNGAGVLATVNFSAVGEGTTPITIFNVTTLDSTLSGITNTLQSGTVTVTTIPEPGNFLLFGVGVASGLFKLRRRRYS
jgi:hypothetical protein